MITPFRYRLAILTHGDCRDLEETLATFDELVRPTPTDTILVIDGLTEAGAAVLNRIGTKRFGIPVIHENSGGFCYATKELWNRARKPGPEYVFWLEADFRFTRTVHLEQLATTLQQNPNFAQMSLLRNPVNDREIKAGGIVQADPTWFHMHFDPDAYEHSVRRYMSQSIYWTTNPSLIQRDFMVLNEWPLERACEGVFTHQLRAKDPETCFGVWGHGEQWVTHIGVRDGLGHGY